MAKLVVEAYPAIDQVRMVNSGTEATMSALRVARAYTNRNKILKFEGCYHGHSDALLVKSGSGTITYGVPTSPGVPSDVVKDTLVCRYNDLDEVKNIFKEQGHEIAAVIVETVAGNMGVVPGTKEFLQLLRDIIGAGLPVGAYGGTKEIMSMVSPVGPVYQAGTLSGNPLAMYMGKKNLKILRDNPNIYEELERKAIKLEQGLKANIEKLGLDYTVNRAGSLVCLFFAKGPINNYDDV